MELYCKSTRTKALASGSSQRKLLIFLSEVILKKKNFTNRKIQYPYFRLFLMVTDFTLLHCFQTQLQYPEYDREIHNCTLYPLPNSLLFSVSLVQSVLEIYECKRSFGDFSIRGHAEHRGHGADVRRSMSGFSARFICPKAKHIPLHLLQP